MSNPKITFAITTHNRCARTLQTLSLLRASAGRLPHEILVVDRGSSDGTAEAVAQRFPQVRLIELDTNHEAAARNLAVSAAGCEFVFLLDDATWPDKGTAELALRMMADQPRLAAASCRVRVMGELRPEADGPAGVIADSAVVLRRQAILEVGGWPIDYEDCMAGYDLSARLWQADWQVQRFEEMAAWREAAGAARADAPRKPLAASEARFWARYAPQGWYERLAGQSAARCEVRRRPLSEEQLASLMGTEASLVRMPKVLAGVQTAA
jgi:GT2 family glycosyltransferase